MLFDPDDEFLGEPEHEVMVVSRGKLHRRSMFETRIHLLWTKRESMRQYFRPRGMYVPGIDVWAPVETVVKGKTDPRPN